MNMYERVIRRMLAVLAEHPEGMSGADVCAAFVGLHSSTVYLALGDLRRTGLIEPRRPDETKTATWEPWRISAAGRVVAETVAPGRGER